MKKSISIVLIIFSILTQAQVNPNGWDTAWVTSLGGPGSDVGRDIKETSDRGFIIAGTTSSFGSGNTSFYIIKTDSLGGHEWSKSIGSNLNDIAYSVDIANDSGYFFSGASNWNIQAGYDGYLIKTNKSGDVLWSKNYGGNDWDFFYNSCIMPDGGLMLCGETYSGSQGGSDFYLVRTNANGDTLWTKSFGSSGDDAFYSVEQRYNRIYLVGKTYNTVSGKSDACVLKLDFNGNVLLQKNFSGGTGENAIYNDVAISNSGAVLLCGVLNTSSYNHYILQKFDSTSFNQIYYNTTSQNLYLRSVIEGYNNSVYSFGPSYGGLGGKSAYYFRFDPNFNYLYSAHFGGSDDEDPYEILKTSKGYAFIGSTKSYGNQSGSVDQNVYLVVFNKKDLFNDYFLIVKEFGDNLSPVGINKNSPSTKKTSVCPNPVTSVYSINLEDGTYDGQILNYKLYDATGRLVCDEKAMVDGDHILLNRKNLPTGIYSYKLTAESKLVGLGKISAE